MYAVCNHVSKFLKTFWGPSYSYYLIGPLYLSNDSIDTVLQTLFQQLLRLIPKNMTLPLCDIMNETLQRGKQLFYCWKLA